MKTAVIVDSVRTGLAKSFRGGFNQTRADDMTAHLVNALLERNPQSRNGMIYYITAAWRLGNKDDALWQYEEYKLVSADDPFEMSLQKQPWDDKIKTLIYEVFKEIENS